jgi:D-alanine transaminase
MITYFNNTYLDKEHVRISPDDRGFLFADGLYEVIRSYGGRLFRMQQHIERLNYGATELRLPTTDFNYLSEVAVELLKRNNLEQSDATVYFQVTRGAAKRGHAFPEPQPQLTIYGIATAFDSQPSQEKMRVGIKAITLGDQRWSRCDMKTIGLTANILANQAAKEAGAQEAILVRDGVLLEGTHSNFMAVFDDTIVTAPASNYILSGITRMAILELCAAQGLKLELKPIFAKDITLASEAFIVGTTVEVTPICHLDGNPVGSGEPGPIVRLLQKHLRETILKNL